MNLQTIQPFLIALVSNSSGTITRESSDVNSNGSQRQHCPLWL